MAYFSDTRKDVENTLEFQRIKRLPRLTLTAPELEAIRLQLTGALKRPEGTWALKSSQAAALYVAAQTNGLVGGLGVGDGKTLVSALIPVVIHPEPARVLLIVPASLVGKTKDDFAELSRHFHIWKGIHIASYEMLGRVDGADFLEKQMRPDVMILDEAHRAKNPKAGVTRRIARYIKNNPNTRYFALSGTVANSLRDMIDHLRRGLGEGSPVPKFDSESDRWSDALDTDAKTRGQRPGPGPLVEFATDQDREEYAAGRIDRLTLARRGFRERLRQTPGVVLSEGAEVGCSLNVRGIKYDVAPQTDEHFEKLRATSLTPDDWLLMQAVEVWACARQLALGMHYIWSPRPPDEWRSRRKAWCAFVRDELKVSRTLDTEKQVADACREGALDPEKFRAWDEIRPSYTPRTKAVWHDTRALDVCKDWLAKNTGIVWTEHGFFGRELSRATGHPYFGQDAEDASGRKLATLAREVLEGRTKPFPIICSIKSCGTGQNLQGWNTNLVASCPTTLWEQLLGRTHRPGQRSDEVTVDVLVGCWEHRDAWDKAIDLASMTKETQGATQKLLLATATIPETDHLGGARWSKTVDESRIPSLGQLLGIDD